MGVRRLQVELDAADEGEGGGEQGEQVGEEGRVRGGVRVDGWGGHGGLCRGGGYGSEQRCCADLQAFVDI